MNPIACPLIYTYMCPFCTPYIILRKALHLGKGRFVCEDIELEGVPWVENDG